MNDRYVPLNGEPFDYDPSSAIDAASDWVKEEPAVRALEANAVPIGAEALPVVRPPRHPDDALPRGRFCSVPAITRVWINRPNVQRPREQQGEHPIFDVLLPDGRHMLVWNVQWAGLTHTRHELDHPVMKGKAVAWIETTADVWVKLTKYGPFERASAV